MNRFSRNGARERDKKKLALTLEQHQTEPNSEAILDCSKILGQSPYVSASPAPSTFPCLFPTQDSDVLKLSSDSVHFSQDVGVLRIQVSNPTQVGECLLGLVRFEEETRRLANEQDRDEEKTRRNELDCHGDDPG